LDWGRAKTILIVSFLLLNLMLGYQLWYDRVATSASGSDTREVARRIEEVMAARNIGLKTGIPKETPNMGELEFAIYPAQGEPTLTPLRSPIPVSLLRDRDALESALSEEIPDGAGYELDLPESGDNFYILHQLHGGFPLFDVKLKLHIEGGVVKSFSQSHAELLGPAAGARQKVLSGLRAVGILAEKLEPGTNIIDIRLGYHGQEFNSETRIFAPYWRIITDRDERYFVHAITGAVE